MKHYKLVLLKDKIKRKNFLKNELKKLILKSVLQNFKLCELDRLESLKKLTFISKKSYISRQNNPCLISGRMGGVFKKWNLSRHNLKNMGKLGMLHNTKINSW